MSSDYLNWLEKFMEHEKYSKCTSFTQRYTFENVGDDIRTCCKKYQEGLENSPSVHEIRRLVINCMLDNISAEIKSEAKDYCAQLEQLEALEKDKYIYRRDGVKSYDIQLLIELHGLCVYRLTQDYLAIAMYRDNCEKAYRRRHTQENKED